MARRKLSKQQAQRIKKQQQEIVAQSPSNHSFSDSEDQPALHGQVVSHHGGQVEVEFSDPDGNLHRVACHLRANLDPVVTGDNIVWQKNGEGGVVVSTEERQSELVRPDTYGNLKPVAANISQMIIVIAPKPTAHSSLIDRYLVVAENIGCNALVLANKQDLSLQEECENAARLQEMYQTIGYSCLSVSAHTGQGFPELDARLGNETTIFVGQSGVGKSSILQRLLPDESIRIGDLSQSKARGRHTTTHTQLYHFPSGGRCIDSPGIREFGLWHMQASAILQGYVDLQQVAENCKFRNCQHNNEPGCEVRSALEQNRLYQQRFDNYKHILETLADVTIKKPKHR